MIMNTMIMSKSNLECRKCGYAWVPRTARPVECPSCKSRNYGRPQSAMKSVLEPQKGKKEPCKGCSGRGVVTMGESQEVVDCPNCEGSGFEP